MNLQLHEDGDRKNVWLSRDNIGTLEDAASDIEQRIAFNLGVRCRLRSAEILDVAPQDIVETDAGWMLRVHQGRPVPRDTDLRDARSAHPDIWRRPSRTGG